MPELPNIAALFNSPPEAIIAQFRKKGYAISWNWQEVWQEANAHAFTVAKATDMNVLQDIREAIEEALTNGTGFRQFQKTLEPKLKEQGWWGKQEIVDPETGEITEVQLGSPHRLKTIYRTNLTVSYSAGRYRSQMKASFLRPWWQYRTAEDDRVRRSHEQLNNIVLRYDDPFWDTHYPPNDWGCRCGVKTYSDRQLKKKGLTVSKGADLKPIAGKGWNYNAAKAVWQPKTDEIPAELARKYVQAALSGPGLGVLYERINRLLKSLKEQGLVKEKSILNAVSSTAKKEEFPVAVLPDTFREAINSKGHTVYLSAQSLAKNLLRHPELGLSDYRALQKIYEQAQLVVKDSPNTIIFYLEGVDDLFTSVKATISGDKMYLTSFRKAGLQRVNNIRKRGEILKDEL
jgi:SPP1 gp7 family putative phage head morphogenesis protein